MIRTQQRRYSGNVPQHNKDLYGKPSAIILNSEKLKAFVFYTTIKKDLKNHNGN